MGLDGGTYITRSDVLRGQSWDMATADNTRSTRGGNVASTLKRKELDRDSARETSWTTCSISGQPLQDPISADYLGHLYNREAVVEFLLGRNGSFADEGAEHRYLNQLRVAGTAFDHLHSLRDIFKVHLTPSHPQSTEANGSAASAAPYVCPLTDLPCTKSPFVALPSCGHVFSSRAVTQMTDGQCATCSTAFKEKDVVPLNGTPEQVHALRDCLDTRRPAKKRKSEKKAHKCKSVHADDNSGADQTS
ncbi:Replication termination factor 2 [Coccomyxa sp. Obi]|nr:Replication termination factor 2 [Coccomyxa sp. Obi]